MEVFHMSDIIPLIGLPPPPNGHSSYNVPCPCCDTEPGKRHMNINLRKNVFRCPRCGFSGGIFDLYAYYTRIPRENVREALIARLDVRGEISELKMPEQKFLTESPLMDIDARSATYEALLNQLTLATDHRANLISRGLPPDSLNRLGYRTTPAVGTVAIAKRLLSDGHYLSGVPGFYREDSQWKFVHEARGILIPVRDLCGRIQGIQIRRDNVLRRKYRWVSSAGRADGCAAETWVHCAGEPTREVILTEGALKADIVHALTGRTVIAVAGVNALTHLEPVLRELQVLGTEKIMTAFDMDFLTNAHVQSGYANLISLLTRTCLRSGTYVWDPAYKGLDDFLEANYFHKNKERWNNSYSLKQLQQPHEAG